MRTVQIRGCDLMEEPEVRIPVGLVALEGNLSVPEGTRMVVLFAHGSGSGRHKPLKPLRGSTWPTSGRCSLG